ncbi:TetR/AcrR family transcriptional regulator [Saccharopolyspora cebuensis]|uniref:TetR/AcrR family transcriptional regulator n=1 Tax=Saccharopolyspora cebuensis TaxID=418759 RepID=A0ABV4CDL8_9PSEU
MRANDGARSFTEQGRRAQIVRAAIDVIVERGYPSTSFGRIAERAGLSSTGMISYHFRGKDDLMDQVVTDIYAEAAELVGGRIDAEQTARGQLLAFVEASVAYYRTHHRHVRALTEITLGRRGDDRSGPRDRELADLAELLRTGQRTGEFRDFDPDVMAVTVRHALDGVALHLGADTDRDFETWSRELVTTVDRATREDPT